MVKNVSMSYLRNIAIVSMVLGLIYLVIGIVEIVSIFTQYRIFLIPADIIGGFVAVTIGLTYIFGIRGLFRGNKQDLGFPLVASILAALYFSIYSLILLADAAECYILKNEEYSGWTPMHSLRIEILVGAIAIIIAVGIWRRIKKDMFFEKIS